MLITFPLKPYRKAMVTSAIRLVHLTAMEGRGEMLDVRMWSSVQKLADVQSAAARFDDIILFHFGLLIFDL